MSKAIVPLCFALVAGCNAASGVPGGQTLVCSSGFSAEPAMHVVPGEGGQWVLILSGGTRVYYQQLPGETCRVIPEVGNG